MKVKRLRLKEFTAFKDTEVEFSPGLNVFIGENATGKSHLMKLSYSILRALDSKERPRGASIQGLRERVREKLCAVFMPEDDQIHRLVNRQRGRKKATVEMTVEGWGSWIVTFSLTTVGQFSIDVDLTNRDSGRYPRLPGCVFIPSREVLAMYDGFAAAYQGRELSFDETYYDLCVALSAKPLRGKPASEMSALIKPLERILRGTVRLEGNRFRVHSRENEGILEPHLLAEGFRKIACLVHLIKNGSLMKNGFLFWDEPEANLNPKLVTQMAYMLRTLADKGIQVFVATHDYLLSHELSLAVEYEHKPRVPSRFFACSRTDQGLVEVEAGATLADLGHNSILDEFAAHYDRERDSFAKSTGIMRGERT